ncbi:MAG: hypothetical protein JJ913_09195 [Rhizobiaceae bacterium]|nr:hypothetical protein [Rhizobiaceae bacterium]
MTDHASSSAISADAGWFDTLARLLDTAVILAVAAAMVVTPLLLHILHPAVGIAAAFVLTAVCAWRMPQAAIVAIVLSFLCQNLVVSLLANHVRDADDFDIIRGYNFFMLVAAWAAIALQLAGTWLQRNRALDPYLKVTVAVIAVIGVYFLFGYVRTGITAIVYLRNIVTPLLLFQICLVVFSRQEVRLGQALSALAGIAILCGVIEFLFRDFWLSATNGQAFWDISGGANWATLEFDKAARETGIVATGLADTFKIDFFNSPLLAGYGIEVMRLFGPNMHAISFAYASCFFSIFSLYRGRFGLAALLAVLLVLTNAKGPLIIYILVACGWVAFRLFGARFAFISICMALLAYAALGTVIGLDIGDYHVIGLMAGVLDFPTNPIGWGIGSGGNLSPDFTTIDWSAAQGAGRTPFAVESSVAVLLHQLGIFAFAIVASYVWIAWRVMSLARITGTDLHAAAALGLMCVVANGLFQEEAYFAPLALALFLALAGMVLGAAARNGIETSWRASNS